MHKYSPNRRFSDREILEARAEAVRKFGSKEEITQAEAELAQTPKGTFYPENQLEKSK
jgi:hypothetical protein